MPKVVNHHHIMKLIMDGAIKGVAENGLRYVTTKNIAENSGYNEAYIYRYFDNVDDLLLKSFIRTDEDIYEIIRNAFYEVENQVRNNNADLKTAARKQFNKCWDEFMNSKMYGIFYFRFYYSPFFKDDMAKHHNELLNNMAKRIEHLTNNFEEAQTLINMVYISTLSYVLLTYSGSLKDDEQTRNFIFESLHLTCTNVFNKIIK